MHFKGHFNGDIIPIENGKELLCEMGY